MTDCRYGFRIVGPTTGARRAVLAAAAFAAYAGCAGKADIDREAYLSAFQFPAELLTHMKQIGSTKGYSGPCWAPWLWIDIDRAGDLERATIDARRLGNAIAERYGLDESQWLAFFSGSKGFHLGVPTSLWAPEPSDTFNRIARRFAERLAEVAGIAIDGAVYDKVRAFRAPNSRHPKTGLHKRRLTLAELELDAGQIVTLAGRPESFELPAPAGRNDVAAADWQAACETVAREAQPVKRAGGNLNRLTLEFIRDGAKPGERARRLFSAAANLAEFACPPPLAHALLEEAALDSGMPPSEVGRQIDCGLAHVKGVVVAG